MVLYDYMNNMMNNIPAPKGMKSVEEIRAEERASIVPNAGEASEEVRKSLSEVDEMLTQAEWDAKIKAAKIASGDINAMIEDEEMIHHDGKALDGNEFAEGEDVNLDELNKLDKAA